MSRNINTRINFEPPASELEIRDALLQFVRKRPMLERGLIRLGQHGEAAEPTQPEGDH